jgi:glutamate-1-semialdehyde 2,1-aminomutase
MSRQSELLREAMRHMPQGVAENYRYWGPDRTVFIQRAKGCELFDVDGITYVDFRLGYGPVILGYGDERVDQAVIAQIQSGGTLTGFATELDTTVVQQI